MPERDYLSCEYCGALLFYAYYGADSYGLSVFRSLSKPSLLHRWACLFFLFYFTIGAPAVDTALEKKELCQWELVTVFWDFSCLQVHPPPRVINRSLGLLLVWFFVDA